MTIRYTKDGKPWHKGMKLWEVCGNKVVEVVPYHDTFYAEEREAWRAVARSMEEQLNKLFDEYFVVMDKVLK